VDESVIWTIALWSGALGILLLTVAGVAALYVSISAHGARDEASTDQSQSSAKDGASTEETASPDSSSSKERAAGGGFWAWVKAWVFAVVHAGTVSLVLGGITFFEDISKASEEIQQTGTVTFPKQLLPETLTGSASRKLLSRPSGNSAPSDDDRSAATDEAPGTPAPDSAEWQVVNLPEGVKAKR